MADVSEETKTGVEEIVVDDNTPNPFETKPISEKSDTKPVEEKKPDEPEVKGDKKEPETKESETKQREAEKKEVEVKVEPVKFADETSEKFFNLIKEGKTDEVYNFLHEKKTLENVANLSPEEQIKLNLKYEHPDFSPEDIQSLFEETYERPEKPEQDEFQTDEDYAAQVAKWEKKNKAFENKLSREAKVAAKNLAAKSSELVLPDIQKAAPEPTAEEIAEMEKMQQAYLQSIKKGVSEISGFSTVIKDGTVDLPIKLTIGEEEKSLLEPELQNFNVQDYFRERWLNADNSWNGKQYAEDVYFLKNRDKILQKVADEAGSQMAAHYVRTQKNIDFSGGRQGNFTPSSQSALDSLQEQAFSQR